MWLFRRGGGLICKIDFWVGAFSRGAYLEVGVPLRIYGRAVSSSSPSFISCIEIAHEFYLFHLPTRKILLNSWKKVLEVV